MVLNGLFFSKPLATTASTLYLALTVSVAGKIGS
jgi:hypothetical protein